VKKLILLALLGAGAFKMANDRFTLIEPLSVERAAIERAAIEHDTQRELGTFCAIAAQRARSMRSDLAERKVVCAAATSEIRFVREDRAVWTLTYTCGIAPWRPGRTAPVASPALTLDVLKEHGSWMINAL
jgi:hypothetical protein